MNLLGDVDTKYVMIPPSVEKVRREDVPHVQSQGHIYRSSLVIHVKINNTDTLITEKFVRVDAVSCGHLLAH